MAQGKKKTNKLAQEALKKEVANNPKAGALSLKNLATKNQTHTTDNYNNTQSDPTQSQATKPNQRPQTKICS
ncbi:hypothetical protein PCASD_07553 [Puccinia coronata f. sp. avenae]|uniref:Uncharacterized protein n=1 Tax=Puccinia coronata f. sp. avenae TaxID=200324 RepID=A0A2N5TGR9_9BASI|nr:hypothetical protein PCASD_07553 [Puccinia coronata f. sp. avenae]